MINPFHKKIFRAEQWSEAIQFLGAREYVFTNGCFDLLHPGHLIYLSQAASLSANMVIGLNSDDSVRNLKGLGRPINNFIDRANMLSALQQVTCVIEFKDETPLSLIEKLKPNVLVKGGDYKIEDIVGRESVESNGGKVVTIPFVGNYSSTNLIEKIKKA